MKSEISYSIDMVTQLFLSTLSTEEAEKLTEYKVESLPVFLAAYYLAKEYNYPTDFRSLNRLYGALKVFASVAGRLKFFEQ